MSALPQFGWTPPLAATTLSHAALRFAERCRIGQRRAVEFIAVEVDDDLVAILDERDRAADRRFRADVADDEADRSAGEARVRHQSDDDAALAAQRRDPRRRIEHLGHARRAARAFVAHDDHVVVLELPGIAVERIEQALLALEHARLAAEQVVIEAALDASELQDRGEFRRQVATEHAQSAGRLVGLRDGIDDGAVGGFGAEALDLLG